jgi:nicotinate-nucleotide pyrophosphorylase (carboxylating)
MEHQIQLAAEVQRNVLAALVEDIGGGDLTALLTPASRRSQGTVISRESAVLAGTAWFDACFRQLDPKAAIRWQARDGDTIRCRPNPVRDRSQHACPAHRRARRAQFPAIALGTATVTRLYVDAVAGTGARIVDTRKTLPGLRLAQKYAVTCGGGTNHRLGLYDGILIKENHIMAAGGVTAALDAGHGDRPQGRLHPDRGRNPGTACRSPRCRRHR